MASRDLAKNADTECPETREARQFLAQKRRGERAGKRADVVALRQRRLAWSNDDPAGSHLATVLAPERRRGLLQPWSLRGETSIIAWFGAPKQTTQNETAANLLRPGSKLVNIAFWRIGSGAGRPQFAIMAAWLSNLRGDIVGGIVSAVVATPLAMGYGMFAFVALGESYFASGALAGLYTAVIVAIVCVLLGDKSTTVYAPRITSTFFLGLLIYGLVHSEIPAIKSGGTSLILAITFSIILLGGIFEALFGLIRLGSLIKFAPQPVMAGFQNTAAILLFLVQLGNVCGFDYNVALHAAPAHMQLPSNP